MPHMATRRGTATGSMLLAGLLAAGLPSIALANAGTPLLWAGFFHLLFGNAFIGVIEGVLIGVVFKVSRIKAIGWMIAANYISAWGGWLLVNSGAAAARDLHLYNAWAYIWMMVGLMFILTLLAEWPFVAVALKGRGIGRSILACLLAQAATYGPLIGWYALASGITLYTKASVVPLAEMRLPDEAVLYYIDVQDGSVRARALAGGPDERIHELRSRSANDRLYVQRSGETHDLWARLGEEHRGPRDMLLIRSRLAPLAGPGGGPDKSWPRGTAENFRGAEPLGEAEKSGWRFYQGFWAAEGLHGLNEQTGEQVGIAFETPFAAWNVRNGVHLPNDQVLFQLGEDQICIFDPATRQVALVARGRGPVVAWKDAPPR